MFSLKSLNIITGSRILVDRQMDRRIEGKTIVPFSVNTSGDLK